MLAFEARASSVLYRVLSALPPGKAVLMPSNVCLAVPATAVAAGLSVEMVDIDAASLEMDFFECLRRAAASPSKYGALIFVRPFGAVFPHNEDFLRMKALATDLLVIDDRCLCLPCGAFENEPSGADLTLFSTGARKQVDLGAGGAGLLAKGIPYLHHLDRPYSKREADSFEHDFFFARDGRQRHRALTTGWLDLRPPREPVSAYLDRIRSRSEEVVSHKHRINSIYCELIPSEAQLPEIFNGWRFNVRVAEPQVLLKTLSEHALFASTHYRDLGPYFGASCINASSLAGQVVNLFNDFYYDEKKATHTGKLVSAHVRKHGCPEWPRLELGHQSIIK